MTDEVIEDALADAVPHPADAGPPDGLPTALFAVIDGVPYTTRWTNKEQRTVHGFPWMFREPGGMPRRVQRLLRERAERTGDGEKFARWMRTYGVRPYRGGT